MHRDPFISLFNVFLVSSSVGVFWYRLRESYRSVTVMVEKLNIKKTKAVSHSHCNAIGHKEVEATMKYSADKGQWNFPMPWNVLVNVSTLTCIPREHKVKDVH